MAENKVSAMEMLLAAESKEEAADVLDLVKTFTEEQNSKLETLLRGVKIGYELAREKTA